MNKRNKTLWGCAAMVAAIIFAAACAKTDEQNGGGKQGGQPDDNDGIEFQIDIMESRATQTTTSSLDRIGVFCYSTPTSGWEDVLQDTYTADYFLNKMVVRTSPTVWWYDGPTKYWPGENEKKLTFFAYAPHVDVQNTYTLSPTVASPTGSPTITYTPPADAIKQVDILWDKKKDQDKFSNGGEVVFNMNHALTSIAFEACVQSDINHFDAPYTIEVLSVGIRNAVASGIFDLNDGQWNFATIANASQLTEYQLTPEEHKGLHSVTFNCQYDPSEPSTTSGYVNPFAGYVPLSKSYATIMLLPQEFRNGAETLPGYPTTVFIAYRTTNLLTGEVKNFTQDIELASHPDASANKWEKGKGITYQFTISLFDGVAVRVKVGAFIAADKWQIYEDEATVDVG